MTIDPKEQVRWWIGTAFLGGLAAMLLPIIVWEFVVRHGNDPGVWSGIGVFSTAIIAGPIGIRVYRERKDAP